MTLRGQRFVPTTGGVIEEGMDVRAKGKIQACRRAQVAAINKALGIASPPKPAPRRPGTRAKPGDP